MSRSYLKPSTVAALCDVHPDTVRKGRGDFGKLQRYQLNGQIRYDAAEVEALIRPTKDDVGAARAATGHALHQRLVNRRQKERIK